MRKIELLSPARDAEIGIEAFNHGADAVYIGAPRFSARAAAGCSVQDIERLAAYGHRFGARTFVALNTIMTDEELRDAERLTHQLYEAGVDALIVQDYGLLTLDLPPIELHASTQMDTRTPEKARLLRDLGMKRVVLARELSVDKIRQIHQAVDVELECFVHGALCVSVSGQCYLSAALTGRSANRGACAQPCRLPMDLLDANGDVIVRDKHLLSLKDMNRSADLEALVEAGLTSLKIEGRLKDMTYVKNLTAYYRRRLDALMEGHPDWHAASEGRCTYTFEPRAAASFNRGFTNYYAHGDRSTELGRQEVIWNMDTPKSMGECLGRIGMVGRDYFMLQVDGQNGSAANKDKTAKSAERNAGTLGAKLRDDATAVLSNGDGLVAQDKEGKIYGFRLNRVDPDSRRLYPAGGGDVCRQLRSGMALYRNADFRFEQLLSKPSADRRIAVDMSLAVRPDGVDLTLTDEGGISVTESQPGTYDPARQPQQENYRKQLSKLGDTCFELRKWTVQVSGSEVDLFLPSSMLSDLRRRACAGLSEARSAAEAEHRHSFVAPDYKALAGAIDARGVLPDSYLANVMNRSAERLLQQMKLGRIEPAYELRPVSNSPVMFTAHCLKFALGCCPKYQHARQNHPEPWSLKIGGCKFVIKFGCQNDCYSELIATFANRNK